jgi:hypothetical protein
MLEAIKESDHLQPPEVWFYGAELLRSLGEIQVPQGVDHVAKRKVLNKFRKRVQADIAHIQLDEKGRPWLQRVQAFYGEPHA